MPRNEERSRGSEKQAQTELEWKQVSNLCRCLFIFPCLCQQIRSEQLSNPPGCSGDRSFASVDIFPRHDHRFPRHTHVKPPPAGSYHRHSPPSYYFNAAFNFIWDII